jgi:rubrerythrin
MFVFGTADDVFAMAVRIEENGKTFYTGAAEKANNSQFRKLFLDLAEMEAGHIEAFKSLRSQLPGSFPADAIWDPEGLAESYLQTTADTHVFTGDAAKTRMQEINTPLEALDMAIQFEKDSVAFFMGMKEILPDPTGKTEIDKLILSEMQHIWLLSRAKKQLQETGSTSIA